MSNVIQFPGPKKRAARRPGLRHQPELAPASSELAEPRDELSDLRAQRAELQLLVARWKREAAERGPGDTLVTDGVIGLLSDVLDGKKVIS